jgi:hypothetical protein
VHLVQLVVIDKGRPNEMEVVQQGHKEDLKGLLKKLVPHITQLLQQHNKPRLNRLQRLRLQSQTMKTLVPLGQMLLAILVHLRVVAGALHANSGSRSRESSAKAVVRLTAAVSNGSSAKAAVPTERVATVARIASKARWAQVLRRLLRQKLI